MLPTSFSTPPFSQQGAKMGKKSPEQHPVPACSDYSGSRKAKCLLLLLFTFTLAFVVLCSCSILGPFFIYSTVAETELQVPTNAPSSPCSSIPTNSICCDRSAFRTDICFMRGDVRMHSPSSSLFLHSTANVHEEIIRPYPRKWETSIMAAVYELRLRSVDDPNPSCEVVHGFPALFFSIGGYTGNVFHEFNDGIIPLYLTAHHYNRDVVLVILDHHNWWVSKYAEILSRISRFPPINFANDSRAHCFPYATVGLRIHDDLTIDPAQAPLNNSILGFRRLLDDAYRPRLRFLDLVESRKPKLTLILRNGSRAVENERNLVAMAEELGFRVEILRPERTTELASIYRVLNGSEVMIGVHGAVMTHLLFMRPGTALLQIVPLGTEWAAETYFGAPARRMGLSYVEYKVTAEESSLWKEYGGEHPVVRDPGRINARGWEETKRVYLDRQTVKLDLKRFRGRMKMIRRYLDRRQFQPPELGKMEELGR